MERAQKRLCAAGTNAPSRSLNTRFLQLRFNLCERHFFIDRYDITNRRQRIRTINLVQQLYDFSTRNCGEFVM